MAYNNTVTLTGNTAAEVKLMTSGKGKPFATLSLYTQDSYQDEAGNWQNTDSIRHNLIAFSPTVIKMLEGFKKGTRITVTGALSYRDFKVVLEDGTSVTKREASIIVKKVELAPLVKKSVA